MTFLDSCGLKIRVSLTKPVTDYRMTEHVFGNSPSPAVAIYSLRRAAREGRKEHGTDAQHFIIRNFYVDDGLTSFPTAGEAVDVMKRTREMLAESSIMLAWLRPPKYFRSI